jgi:transposase InsO family protein
MPWKESKPVDERMRLIARVLDGERMTDLCREFGISRKTGNKFLERYKRFGPGGLQDLGRRPAKLANQSSPQVQKLVLDMKRDKPTWGAAKIREYLVQKHPSIRFPVRSTVHEILDRHGLVRKQGRKRGKYPARPTHLGRASEANEIWCTDFKGQFRLGNRKYCYPLTVSDQFSRYLLACEGLESTGEEDVSHIFRQVFEEYGLPNAIRSDNGCPFSTRTVFGLSKLSVWWLRLGIRLERIQPGHPEQNGRHERMHRTLKEATVVLPSSNFLQQQERFDSFREEYNEERPHEALKMKPPASAYKSSKRRYPEQLPVPEYSDHDFVKLVYPNGSVRFGSKPSFHLSGALAGQPIGLAQVEEKLWRVTFMDLDLGYYDEETNRFTEMEQNALDVVTK